ncbi:MAG: hypothetical protein ACREMX_11245 [Gemmatimonadales bacterium]
MAQPPGPDSHPRLDDGAGPAGTAGRPPAPVELPVERSRFSRWLASFGLGDAPVPLLKPTGSGRRKSMGR